MKVFPDILQNIHLPDLSDAAKSQPLKKGGMYHPPLLIPIKQITRLALRSLQDQDAAF